jgi:hypothetical protein
MRALGIVGIPTVCAGIGFLAGALIGFREGGDMNFAPAIYAPVGALCGGFVGLGIAAVVAR